MTDSVRDFSQTHGRSLQNLQAKQKREMEHLAKRHELNVAEAKEIHQRDLADLRQSNLHEVAQEVHKKEQVLGALRESMEKTRELSEAESRRIQALGAQQRAQKIAASEVELQQLTDRFQERMTDVTQKNNTTIRDQFEAGRMALHQQSEDHRVASTQQNQEWTHKIQQQRDQFTHQHRSESEKFEALNNRRQVEQKKILSHQHQQHEQRLNDMNNKHVALNERITGEHQRSLHDKERFFETKYQAQLEQHLKSEKLQEELAAKGLSKSKDDYAQRTKFFADRKDDPFFRFTELKVEVRDHPQHYEIRVPVPEYAKEELMLTAKAKELVVTINRRFEDERTSETGGVAKVNKVESLVKRMSVDQVMNPRKLTKTWQDGVAIFTVAKA